MCRGIIYKIALEPYILFPRCKIVNEVNQLFRWIVGKVFSNGLYRRSGRHNVTYSYHFLNKQRVNNEMVGRVDGFAHVGNIL